jgi:hypothetical protein
MMAGELAEVLEPRNGITQRGEQRRINHERLELFVRPAEERRSVSLDARYR